MVISKSENECFSYDACQGAHLAQEGDAERRKQCEQYASNIANLQAQGRSASKEALAIRNQRDQLNELYNQQETSVLDASQKYFGKLFVTLVSETPIPSAGLASGTLSLFNPTSNVIEKSLGAVGVSVAAGKLAGTFNPTLAFSKFSVASAFGAFAIDYGSEVAPIFYSNWHQSQISQDYTQRAADIMNGKGQGIWEAEKVYRNLYNELNCQDFE